jgi:pimeloyl-ACP methyl ester carboxylesterase
MTSDYTRAFEVPHAMLDLPGGRLAYYRFGRGPDLVAVHGWPLHAATFRKLLPIFAPHFTVHLIDLPGAGQTCWRTPANVDTNTAALRAAVDHLDLRDFAMIGHDSGAMFTRMAAANDPRVRALVVAGSEIPGHHAWQLATYVALSKLPAAHRLLGGALQLGPLRRSSLGLGGCFGDMRCAEGDFDTLFIRPLARPEVALRAMELLNGLDPRALLRLREAHGNIRCPVLCVWGEDDPFFPIHKARAMLKEFGGDASLVAAPGARLFVHEECPDVFEAHALPFLTKHLSTGDVFVPSA